MRTWNKRQAGSALASVFAGVLVMISAGCGSKSDEEAATPTRSPLPCDDEGELVASCGVACDAVNVCPGGMYCSSTGCYADCTPGGGQCSGQCRSDGHCVQADDTGLGGGGPPMSGTVGGDPNDPGCIQQGIEFESLTPTVELLVDRSGSMDANFGMQDRWNTIRDILVDPMDGFTFQMQSKVRFGLTLYTGFTAEDAEGASCPNLIQVPIALNNYTPIAQVFMANEIGNNTPSAESLLAVTTKLEMFTEIGPKVIVFATDGDPDSCTDPDSNGTQPPRDAVEAAVQAAWDKGISTYAIAVGDEIMDLQHLQRVAEIGRGGEMGAHYYEAQDANQLTTAFAAILGVVISCDFDLNGTVEPGNYGSGTVKVNDLVIPYGDANGWEMPDGDTIRLNGTACDALKVGMSSIDIAFPCGTVDIR
jgi:hypothetical protein